MKKIMYLLVALTMISFAYAGTLDQQGILRNATDGALYSGSYIFNISIRHANIPYHPFTFPIGVKRTTFLLIPACSVASITSSTFL